MDAAERTKTNDHVIVMVMLFMCSVYSIEVSTPYKHKHKHTTNHEVWIHTKYCTQCKPKHPHRNTAGIPTQWSAFVCRVLLYSGSVFFPFTRNSIPSQQSIWSAMKRRFRKHIQNNMPEIQTHTQNHAKNKRVESKIWLEWKFYARSNEYGADGMKWSNITTLPHYFIQYVPLFGLSIYTVFGCAVERVQRTMAYIFVYHNTAHDHIAPVPFFPPHFSCSISCNLAHSVAQSLCFCFAIVIFSPPQVTEHLPNCHSRSRSLCIINILTIIIDYDFMLIRRDSHRN